MYCKNCGEEINEQAAICIKCGFYVNRTEKKVGKRLPKKLDRNDLRGVSRHRTKECCFFNHKKRTHRSGCFFRFVFADLYLRA